MAMNRYAITPVPKPRMTRRDKVRGIKMRPGVARYMAFKDKCRALKVYVPQAYAHIIFVMPIPKSWTNKKKDLMRGQPHLQVPDRDNLEKALNDAVHGNDSHLWDARTTKIWGDKGAIIINDNALEKFDFDQDTLT